MKKNNQSSSPTKKSATAKDVEKSGLALKKLIVQIETMPVKTGKNSTQADPKSQVVKKVTKIADSKDKEKSDDK